MLLQKKNGDVGLLSRFSDSSTCMQCGLESKSPSLFSEDPGRSTRNRQSSALNWRSMNELLSPAKEVANGSPGSPELGCFRRSGREFGGELVSLEHPHRTQSTSPQRRTRFRDGAKDLSTGAESTVGWRHSSARLSSCSSGAFGPPQPSARRPWRSSERDLRVPLPETVQKEVELVASLKDAALRPRGEMKELRKLEADLNVMKFELLSLRQRMESSFALLEKEKTWLETMSSGDRKQKREREDKIFTLKMKLLKAKSYSGKRRHASGSQDSSPNEPMGKKNIGQAVSDIPETLAAPESCTKALDEERKEVAQQPKPAREVFQNVPFAPRQMVSSQTAEANQRALNSPQAAQVLHEGMGQLQAAYKSISPEEDAPHHQGQDLPLELEHAGETQEGCDDQVPALHGDTVGTTSPVSQQDPEKVLLRGELESARQANKELSLEVAESHQSLETTLAGLRHLEAEKKNLESCVQELENKCARLLGEREERSSEGRLDWASQEEELKGLQETCKNLRESLSLLQREKDLSEIRSLELEAVLHGQAEETKRRLAEQQQVAQSWQGRWEQTAVALKTKEEELERAHVPNQASSPELGTPPLLQIEPDACQEDLEPERNPSRALRHHVQQLESGSQSHMVPTKEYAECSSEKQRLDLLVASLEEQLEEKEQALRRLEGAKDEAQTEREKKISFLEQKLAEMEAAQVLPGLGSNKALKSQEGQKSVPGEDDRPQGTCARCSAALAQLNRVIPSTGSREKAGPNLACLYQLRDLLKGGVLDQAPVPTLGQSSSRDPIARVTRSPQEEKEILKQQHQLVTEQLKELFRQRQEQEQSKKQLRGGKDESLRRPWKSEEGLAMPESTRPRDDHRTTSDIPCSSKEVQSLQQQLKEKTETISSMASKIQELQQKNESLMKAKLRFQQQIQQIRNLPKQRPERSPAELLVPRISASLGQDSQSAPGSDSSVPSPRSDEPPSMGSGEDLRKAPLVSHHHSSDEDQRRGGSSDEGASQTHCSVLPPAQPSPPVSTVPSIKLLSLELLSSQQADNEVALLSPQSPALLSPRPFGPPRPWSPFKFKGQPEFPEDRERH